MWKIISVTSPGSPKKTKWQAGLMIYVKRFLILPMGKVWYLDFLGIDCRTIMSKIHIYIYILVGNSTNKNINYPHPSWIIFEQLPVASTFKKAKFNLLGKHIIHWKFLHTKKTTLKHLRKSKFGSLKKNLQVKTKKIKDLFQQKHLFPVPWIMEKYPPPRRETSRPPGVSPNHTGSPTQRREVRFRSNISVEAKATPSWWGWNGRTSQAEIQGVLIKNSFGRGVK